MVEMATRLSVIDCAGSPREIGLAHGEACRDVIADGLGRWADAIEARRGEAADAYLRRFLGGSGYLAMAEQLAPDLMTELRAIAEGADQPLDRILAYNLMDEEWTFSKEDTGLRPAGQAPGCTSIALGTRVIAQTMDIPGVHDGTQVALRIRPDAGPDQIVFSAAGMIGLNGANAAGVGVVVNSLAQLLSSRDGLPVSLVVRGIVGRATAAEAAAFVEAAPHAIGQHYLIGDGTETISLEAAANPSAALGAGSVRRVAVGERYVHANHPLADLERGPEADEMEHRSNTQARQHRAEALLGDGGGATAVEAVLADREAPISCSREHGWMTFGGTSITWDGDGLPAVRIAPGPPHETAWETVGWA